MSEEIVLYVKNTCPWCIDAMGYLDKNGYAYRKVDVQSSGAAFSEMEKISGQSRVPTMVYGSKILPDFGIEELVPFLKKENILPD